MDTEVAQHPLVSTDGDAGASQCPLRDAVVRKSENRSQLPKSLETAFLLHAIRAAGKSRAREPIQQIIEDPEFDWEQTLRIARRHQVSSLLYEGVRQTCADSVPSDLFSKLQSRYRDISLHNRYRVAELLELIDRFIEEDIRAIPYKGPVLANVVHGDIALRSFADLDLLVAKEHISQAATVLIDRGFDRREAPLHWGEGPILGGPLVPPLTYEWKFDRPDDNMMVEIGWRLHTKSAPLALDFEGLWQRRDHVSMQGNEIPCLSPIDRLFVLTHHGAMHRWGELKWIHDFAAAMKSSDLPEWEVVNARAETAGVGRRLRTAVALTATLFDAPENKAARHTALEDEKAVELASEIVKQYLTNPLYQPSAVAEFLFRLRSVESIPKRALAMTDPFLPKLRDYRRLPLPQRLFVLYYLIRPLRLVEAQLRGIPDRLC